MGAVMGLVGGATVDLNKTKIGDDLTDDVALALLPNGVAVGAERVKMSKKPKLMVGPWVKGQSMFYCCSKCGRKFMLPEDLSPREAMAEILSAFRHSVREEHPEAGSSEQGP
jgi:hypothetical protein